MRARQTQIATAAFLAALSMAFGAMAQEGAAADSGAAPTARDWTLRFGLMGVENSGDTDVTVEPGAAEVDIDGGGGLYVSFERRVTPLVGLEMGLLGTGSDMRVRSGDLSKHYRWGNEIDTLAMGSLTVGLNFHFVNDGSVDFYAGPLVAFNRYEGVSVHDGYGHGWWDDDEEWTTVHTRDDSEVTWGAKVGVDFLVGRKHRWSVGGSLTYMDATYDFERKSEPGKREISLDPVLVSVGVGFRF